MLCKTYNCIFFLLVVSVCDLLPPISSIKQKKWVEIHLNFISDKCCCCCCWYRLLPRRRKTRNLWVVVVVAVIMQKKCFASSFLLDSLSRAAAVQQSTSFRNNCPGLNALSLSFGGGGHSSEEVIQKLAVILLNVLTLFSFSDTLSA